MRKHLFKTIPAKVNPETQAAKEAAYDVARPFQNLPFISASAYGGTRVFLSCLAVVNGAGAAYARPRL